VRPGVATEPDDLEIVAALARGEQAALGRLYDRHASLLLSLGLRIVGDRTLAEDLLHDVFLEAWHHAREFDADRGTVRAWLVTRMRSRALDRRATAARHARIAEELGRQSASSTEGADANLPLDNQRLRTEVATMAPELTAVIELAYFEGLSSAQIAERLSIPTGTVKSRMARALQSLRTSLGQEPTPAPRGEP
jgi:RNA polymerase sigma-70 factor (ECF subfamily)